MSLGTLVVIPTAVLGLLTVSTNIIVSTLFPSDQKANHSGDEQ
jgi:hypothetical protein